MIISHRHKFILLAPWKTASSTVHLRLEPFNESLYNRLYDFNPHLQRVVHQHITYAEFRAIPEFRLNYLTGAFVRNPYDRVYSGFRQLMRAVEWQPSANFTQPWIRTLVMCQISEIASQLAAAEFDFDKWFKSIDDHQILEIGRNTSFPLHPAHYWTGIDREIMVDFVGKVETFEQDFTRFCLATGLGVLTGQANANVSEGLSDAVEIRPRYIDRMNAASIGKINTLFDADFDLFGYDRF